MYKYKYKCQSGLKYPEPDLRLSDDHQINYNVYDLVMTHIQDNLMCVYVLFKNRFSILQSLITSEAHLTSMLHLLLSFTKNI